jgi:FAD binding domain
MGRPAGAMESPEHDVIVVGAGNAALCAALSAREHGARVVVLECAPEAEAGGNSRFAGGVMRFAFDGVDDLRKVAELTEEEIAGADFGTYPRTQYYDDLFRLTQYRTDPTLVELLVTRSLDTMIWLRGQGARFVPIYGRQAGKVGGRWKFFGGLPIEASGGGAGLVQSLTATAHRRGVEILYQPTRPPAGSPSPSGACASTPTPRWSITTRPRSRASTPRARWSAGSSTSTIRAAPGSSRAPSSAAWPAPRPRGAPSGREHSVNPKGADQATVAVSSRGRERGHSRRRRCCGDGRTPARRRLGRRP